MFIRYYMDFKLRLLKRLSKYLAGQKVHPRVMDLPKLTDVKLVYESKDYVVAYKKYDVVMYSDDKNRVSLSKQLQHVYPHLHDPKMPYGFRYANRIDYSTSGLCLICLNKKATAKAMTQFQRRLCNKYYLAIVHGHVATRSVQYLESYLGTCTLDVTGNTMCSRVGEHCRDARYALTRVCPLEYGTWHDKRVTKVLIKIITGRRHQIRVQMADLGHLVVGDYTYSKYQDEEPYRMMLHSYRMQIELGDEVIDIRTADPFTVESHAGNRPYRCEERVRGLDEAFTSIDTVDADMRAAEERAKEKRTREWRHQHAAATADHQRSSSTPIATTTLPTTSPHLVPVVPTIGSQRLVTPDPTPADVTTAAATGVS